MVNLDLTYSLAKQEKFNSDRPSMVISNARSTVACLGEIDSLEISSVNSEGDPWGAIEEFIKRFRGNYIFGYLGFDLHQHKESELKTANHPDAHLFVPERVFKVSDSGVLSLFGPELQSVRLTEQAARVLLDTSAHLNEDNNSKHLERVKGALEWINGQERRRITLAQRISFAKKLDFLGGLAIGPEDSQVISRTFYFNSPHLEMFGRSPELLAYGSPVSFDTFKLSGTAPKPADPESILSQFKLKAEHSLSAAGQYETLAKLGKVRRTAPKLLELSNLFHIMTQFTTHPKYGSSVTDCLRSVFPSGVQPYDGGMRLISKLEDVGRGAYYGLAGVINPDQSFEFFQVLRTFLRDKTGCHGLVGSAITSDSTPENEVAETHWKLNT